MQRHPILWFYLLAFSISWIGLIPAVLGSQGIAPFDSLFVQFFSIFFSVGPALAAVIMSQITQGKIGSQHLLNALLKWQVGWVWYLVALLGPAVILIAGQFMTTILGLTSPPSELEGNPFLLGITVFIVILSNTSEEIGWRGFALPHLQKRYNALFSTLIVGLLWSFWHFPILFLMRSPMDQSHLPWLISIVANAFVYTWLYNSTQGSILLVALLHISGNIFGAWITGVSPIAYAILSCLEAITLILVFGSINLSNQKRVYLG